MKRTVSDNSLSNSRGDGKAELKFGGKSKGKLWPFIKKNKVLMVGARCETSFIKCGDFDFIFQSQKDFKSVVSECKQKKRKKKKKKTSVLLYVKTAFLFGGGTFAMAICLIPDALSLYHVTHTNRFTDCWAVSHHAFHS